MRQHPYLFEIHALRLIIRLSAQSGRRITLGSIPDEYWTGLKEQGFDLIWLMGVWKRSPAAREKALSNEDLKRAYDKALPGWNPEDVSGSPYAVFDYSPDPELGTEKDLLALKSQLNRHGLKLILDFVPNHLAQDHPWTVQSPWRFVSAKGEQSNAPADWFFRTPAGAMLAHGRDPYFPPWSDTVQVNFFSREMREALTGELLRISKFADGVRCDMAMLGLNRVFRQVWGPFVSEPEPPEEFWPQTVSRIKKENKDFIFIAEVYWNLEWELQQAGFDFTYDKTLYDRLLHSGNNIREHLVAEDLYHLRCARFIENHDEARAAEAFGRGRSLAAAAIIATLPGLRFFHEGQNEGNKIRIPIQLRRAQEEPVDPEIREFYKGLMKIAGQPILHEGNWHLLDTESAGMPANHLLAWSWTRDRETLIVMVQYGGEWIRGNVRFKWRCHCEQAAFTDLWTGKAISPAELSATPDGLTLQFGPWQSRFILIQEKEG